MKENDKKITIKGHNVIYFDDSHTYFIDGEETLSSTQITNLINPFKIMKIPINVLKKAGDKGTKIHQAIETFLKTGEKLDEKDKHYGYFKAFLTLYDDIKKDLEIESLEHIAISVIPYNDEIIRLIGTIDCLGKYKSRKVIIDWKTSRMISVPEWRTQLSIYRELVKYTHDIENIEEIDLYVGWLKEDGKGQLIKIEPLSKNCMSLLFKMILNKELIKRFNLLKYEIYGNELIK